MKGNEISVKKLRQDGVEWLTNLHQTMVIKEYGKGSVRNYCQEMTLLFLLQTGKDITLCPVCGKGKMELIKTFIYHHGCLVNASQLRNRGSPKIKSKKVIHEKSA